MRKRCVPGRLDCPVELPEVDEGQEELKRAARLLEMYDSAARLPPVPSGRELSFEEGRTGTQNERM